MVMLDIGFKIYGTLVEYNSYYEECLSEYVDLKSLNSLKDKYAYIYLDLQDSYSDTIFIKHNNDPELLLDIIEFIGKSGFNEIHHNDDKTIIRLWHD